MMYTRPLPSLSPFAHQSFALLSLLDQPSGLIDTPIMPNPLCLQALLPPLLSRPSSDDTPTPPTQGHRHE